MTRWLGVALILWAGVARADAPPDRMARLVGLAHAWLEARVSHPAMLRDDVHLDEAAVAAIPKVEAATTKAQYAAAIGEVLAVFHDPATRVDDPAAAPALPKVPAQWLERPKPKLAVVTVAALAAMSDHGEAGKLAAALPGELEGMAVVVFDLRAPGFDGGADLVDAAAGALPVVTRTATARGAIHHGFRTQQGETSGGYDSQYALAPRAAPLNGKAGVKHVVFVTDAHTRLPSVALGLQASGLATIVSSDPISDATTAGAVTVELPYGLVARVRTDELMMPDGTGLAADVLVAAPKSPHAVAVELAVKLLGGAKPPPHRAGPPVRAALPVVRDDRDWPEQLLPSRELRLFAAMRMWGILARFYPYLDLVPDWDAQLAPALAAAEAATDAPAYRDALVAMGAHLHDGHIGVWQPASPVQMGEPPIEVRLVDGRAVVTVSWDPEHRVRVGDELLAIDGVPFDTLRARRRPYATAGTPASLVNAEMQEAILGPQDAPAKLDLRGADGPRTVTVPRNIIHAVPTGAHYKLLLDNIGYADLTQLTPDEVDPMFTAFAKARGIVLDMRGYPHGTAWPIAPHINVRHAIDGAQFYQPLVGNHDYDGYRVGTWFAQPLPQDPKVTPYAGKLAVLIDDRAISQAEHSCLFFEAAASPAFVGTATHGTNGDVTILRLPGGARLSFTGQAVRHADGRQLQQLGIQPTIRAVPTLAGLRAGKDEVLDRATAWIRTGR